MRARGPGALPLRWVRGAGAPGRGWCISEPFPALPDVASPPYTALELVPAWGGLWGDGRGMQPTSYCAPVAGMGSRSRGEEAGEEMLSKQNSQPPAPWSHGDAELLGRLEV